ncbi:transketolase family protein [Leuconostoc gelidum]|uniref:transketolase family protein n=1 Tax=Leuconostoc gelidum TaxID=1244 RepID=UPI00027E6656|nr:transketolase [Leuconostoc gelidum]AFS40544.1 transketolase [Leuconostoc gelidum JB7]
MNETLALPTESLKLINSMRLIANQMISKAGSGHPGIALGAAPILYELYANQLVVDPDNPDMINRDRFVLSAGHGAALLYTTLYAAGFDLSSADLAHFRSPHSKTPGHPEVGITPGVEATTGPLGQGLGMAVGMAMAEAKLHDQFPNVVDHYTYVLVGDGDLMEGVSHEAASLAGKQGLSKLIVIHDDNSISLDGDKNRSDISDNMARFASYGWHVLEVPDGNDVSAIHHAIDKAKINSKPTFISVKTIIGNYGPYSGTNKAHGTPLTQTQLDALATNLNTEISDFEIDIDVLQDIRQRIHDRLTHQQVTDIDELTAYKFFTQHQVTTTPKLTESIKSQAGRKISKFALQAFSKQLPQLWGGSADLVASTNAEIVETALFNADNRSGRNIAFGVREFGMGAVMNGIALHGGTKIFGATFLVFSDYMKAAIRLSALQKLPVIYVFTHDSITVGEDGPTHQPVEQIMSLRLIPGIDVLRPGTAEEITAAWQKALMSVNRPTVLILSRGAIGSQGTAQQAKSAIENGAANIATQPKPVINLIASGSEVQLALTVSRQLNVPSRVISMPNLKQFLSLDLKDQTQIIPKAAAENVIIEAGTTLGLQVLTGDTGLIFGIDQFGMSAAPQMMLDEYGLNASTIVKKIAQYLEK